MRKNRENTWKYPKEARIRARIFYRFFRNYVTKPGAHSFNVREL